VKSTQILSLKNLLEILERMFEIVKENVPSNPSLKFAHNFQLESQISNKVLEMKVSLIIHINLNSSKFFEKFILHCLNEV